MVKLNYYILFYIFRHGNEKKLFFFKKSLLDYIENLVLSSIKNELVNEIFNRSDISKLTSIDITLRVEEEINKKSTLREKLYSQLDLHNEKHISKELVEAKDFLDNVEKNPLTLCQRKAVIDSNKHTLVLAGAGSGKTSVIKSKVTYLVQKKGVNPKEILLLAYNKDAVKELKERIGKKINGNISIHTFHAVGLKLRKLQSDRSHESLSALESDQKLDRVMLGQIIKENMGDSNFVQSMFEFANIEYYKNKKSKKSKEGRRKEANEEFRAITGQKVKSHGELVIANYLFYSGIDFKYEANLKNETKNIEVDKQINPDFYLPDYEVWIEHWAIDRNGKDPFTSNQSSSKYIDDMKKKKRLYKKLNLKLIETCYGDKQKDKLEEVLQHQLDLLKVEKNPNLKHDPDAFLRFMEENPGPGNKILKSLDYFSREVPTEDEFASMFVPTYGKKTAKRLAYGIAKIYKAYMDKLESNNSYTFDCMIHDGIKALDEDLGLKWKYVIVDEYQDISNMRFRLLKKLVESLDASLFCVGDDWQSINGFSGSNIKYILDFKRQFNHSMRRDIEFTFRYKQDLADISKKFVTQDYKLLNKKVLSSKKQSDVDDEYSLNIVNLKYQREPYLVLSEHLRKLDKISDKDILFLTRTNYALKKFKQSHSHYFKFVKNIRFKTIHSSKGLEASIVIMLDLDDERNGLPSGNGNTLFQKCLRPEPQELEERRLFYVGLTRAKEKIYIPLINTKRESSFVKELDSFELPINNIDLRDTVIEKRMKTSKCPKCGDGKLVERTNSYNGTKFLGCSNYRKNKCNHTQKIVQEEFDDAA